MKLVLQKTEFVNRKFVKFLIRRIQNNIVGKLSVAKLIHWEEYIKNLLGEGTSVKTIVQLGIKNISYKEYSDVFIIGIKEHVYVPRTKYKVLELCKQINYGTIGMKEYPVFTTVFDYVDKNINKYLHWYSFLG